MSSYNNPSIGSQPYTRPNFNYPSPGTTFYPGPITSFNPSVPGMPSAYPTVPAIPAPSYPGAFSGNRSPFPMSGSGQSTIAPHSGPSGLSFGNPGSIPPSFRPQPPSFNPSSVSPGITPAWMTSPSLPPHASAPYVPTSSNAGFSPAPYQPLDTSFLRYPTSMSPMPLPPSSFSGVSFTQPPSLSGRAYAVNSFSLVSQMPLPLRNHELTVWTPHSFSFEKSSSSFQTLKQVQGHSSFPQHQTRSSSFEGHLDAQRSLRLKFEETIKIMYQMHPTPERPFATWQSMGTPIFAIQINPQTTLFVDPVAVTECFQRASSAQRWAFQAQLAQLTSRREVFDRNERRLSPMQQVNTFVIKALRNPRMHAALKAMTGAIEATNGASLAASPFAPLGVVLVFHGADRFSTGLYTTITGEQRSTMTCQLLQKMGLNSERAENWDDNLNFIGTLGASGLITKLARQAATTQLVTSSHFKLPPPYISEAYLAAKSGGKHAPLIDLYRGKTAKEILKGITSYEKQIAHHQDKILNPSKYYPDWNKLDLRRRQALIDKKWPAEIECYTEEMNILQTILEQKR